jgi:hypothetical protein
MNSSSARMSEQDMINILVNAGYIVKHNGQMSE